MVLLICMVIKAMRVAGTSQSLPGPLGQLTRATALGGMVANPVYGQVHPQGHPEWAVMAPATAHFV